VDELIRAYGLEPHPEGGWYRETYRSTATLPGTDRGTSTAIYYLLAAGHRSCLHRIDADEVWHFYRGDALLVVELVPDGPARVTRLDPDHPQHVVPAGTWFGAVPAPGSAWSLVGCTVAPAFEFAGFELGERPDLVRGFPQAAGWVEQLTPDPDGPADPAAGIPQGV
jgi:predicted cupin superfamily sugar epimerase